MIIYAMMLRSRHDWMFGQGNWEFAERARQSIQEEEGASAAKTARGAVGRRYRTQSSLDKPLSHSALTEVTLAALCLP